MVWAIIGLIFGLLFLTAFFGDYTERELEEDYKRFEILTHARYG